MQEISENHMVQEQATNMTAVREVLKEDKLFQIQVRAYFSLH
jgi:hypothetical protein